MVALLRRHERLAAATVRAVGGAATADLRGRRVFIDRTQVPVFVPYLAIEQPLRFADRPIGVRRGIADGLGLRLRHSDPRLHGQLGPNAILERVVFDIAEQFRCESLADPALPGLRANLTAAFTHWSDEAQAARVAETGVGLLVFTVTHMMRSRLLRATTSAAVDEQIESTRANLARLVGHALARLPATARSQTEFAAPAREIARLVAEMVEDAREATDDPPQVVEDNALLVPIDWELVHQLGESEARSDGVEPQMEQRYHAFTVDHDVQVDGVDLYPDVVLRRLRRELDVETGAQSVRVARLALQLRPLFPGRRIDGWRGGVEDGQLDPARLAQVVADPMNRSIRRTRDERPVADGAVTFLIDTSGSMKLQRYEAVAVLVDTLTRALEAADVATEVLGFTTAAWAGGQPAAEWRNAGSPSDPGRLNELQHIVYKHAGQSWRQARLGLAAMTKTDHYREGIAGEALAWAHERLITIPLEPVARRLLVLISDGSPSDAATANANREDVLADHLQQVVSKIEDGRTSELGVIALDGELDVAVERSVPIDLTGALTIGTYSVMAALFGDGGRGRGRGHPVSRSTVIPKR